MSRSLAASTVAGGYGSEAPRLSYLLTKVTFIPCSSSLSATEIASNVPVSSKTTAGPVVVILPPNPKMSQLE